MALSDMYELKHFMAFGSIQDVMNVYHFEKLNPSLDAEDLATRFAAEIVGGLRAAQTAALDHVSLEVTNLDDPTDFYIYSLAGLSGTVTGERLNTFTSFKCQFLRRRTDMKHGFKRWPGVAESAVNGEAVESATLTQLNGVAQQLVDGLTDGGEPPVTLFNYVIIARICVESSPGSGICIAYRLPENDLELEFYSPAQYNMATLVTSQVSRRR